MTDPTVDRTEPVDRTEEWDALRAAYLAPSSDRQATIGRGVHHVALIATDVETTIRFYQGVLGFPLTELFENRDYPGSTHFFFDIGNGNSLAFFDFPGLGLDTYAEVLGGLHHLAISVSPDAWAAARQRVIDHDVPIDFEYETSLYLRGPDGERIELISDDLGEMYGSPIG